MKSTDIERIDRELRRARKKEESLQKRVQRDERSVGDYIKLLYSLFAHDARKIYNVKDNPEIEKLLSEMKKQLPEKQWDNVLRKAVKETRIGPEQRELAVKELTAILELL
jgi:DnaJ-domain-containing protein 1